MEVHYAQVAIALRPVSVSGVYRLTHPFERTDGCAGQPTGI